MLTGLWRKSKIKRYLNELIDAKINDFARKNVNQLPLIFREEYFRLRWKEIAETLRIESLQIYLGNGLKMKLYSDSIISKEIYFDVFENSELKFLQHFLKKDDVFIDAGSNVGLYSLYASPVVGENGKVFAFEPVTQSFIRLEENIALNDLTNIIPVKVALSDTDGLSQIQLAENGFDAWNSLAKPSLGKLSGFENVKIQMLDHYLAEAKVTDTISLIKIDVEGWEIPVLKGCETVLKDQSPVLMVEFTDKNAVNAGYTCKQLYCLIQDYGYSLFSYNSSKNSLIIHELQDEYPYMNLIAAKDIAVVNDRLINAEKRY